MTHLKSQSTTLPTRPWNPQIFCCLHSNIFDAATLFQTSCVVHWNAPREDIFYVWCHDFFVLCDVHSQHFYLQEESLPHFLLCWMLQKELLRICADRILSSADKQLTVDLWQTKSVVRPPLPHFNDRINGTFREGWFYFLIHSDQDGNFIWNLISVNEEILHSDLGSEWFN